jgi:HD-GYP domain-containing protein (c-di-GMP phosphodiesterase class II)
MMMDISLFKELFSSLSRISQWEFELWDLNELIFTSGAEPDEESSVREHRAFSAEVMREAAFRHASFQGKYDLFGTPTKIDGEIVGSLIAYRPNSHRAWQSEDIPSGKKSHAVEMESFLTHLAALIEETSTIQKESEEIAEDLAQNFEDLALYGRISSKIQALKFSNTRFRAVIEEVQESVGVDLAFLEIPSYQEHNVVVSTSELPFKMCEQQSFIDTLIEAISQEPLLIEEGYFIVNDSSITPMYRDLHHDPFRFLAVKMQHNAELDGLLGLVSFNVKQIFRRSELRLLMSIVEQIATLITNMNLYRDLERFVMNMVKSLVNAIEAKDIYTRGHSERVNRYSLLMADRLGLDEEQKECLNWASILHDIGKIGIPEAILNKPASLNEEEFRIIQEHSKKGSDILEPLEQLSDSLPAILHHHERYDGEGYSDGLKGKDIPLLARIISIADTYDAINSNRAYRIRKSPSEALDILEQAAGSQLDPQLVEVFKQVFQTVLMPEDKSGHGR